MTDKSLRRQQVGLWFQANWAKLAALMFWLFVIAVYWSYANAQQLTAWEVLKQLAGFFLQDVTGPIVFVLMFTFQPLVLFPSAAMGIISGTLYGPYWGFVYTTCGALGAATVTYWVGYFFGQEPTDLQSESSRWERYRRFLHTNTFETLVFLHLIFAPYDFVNYLSGYLRLKWWPFFTAAFIGSIPGMITFVLFGASLELDDVSSTPELNVTTLLLSVSMLLISLGISRWLKQRDQNKIQATAFLNDSSR